MSRELDAEIAEKLFNQKSILETILPPELIGNAQILARKDYILLNPDGSLKMSLSLPGGPIRVAVLHYSTRIVDAVLVIERMCELGFNWQLKGNVLGSGLVSAAFDDQHYHGQVHRYRSGGQKTKESAICIAALEAYKARPELFLAKRDVEI